MRKSLFFVFVLCLLTLGIIGAKNVQATCSALSDAEAQCYLNRYEDLQLAFGTNLAGAKAHWLTRGCTIDNRHSSCPAPTPLDDAKAQCYLNRYDDLRNAFGASNLAKAKEHWMAHGSDEGRNASCSGASTPTPSPTSSSSPTPTPTSSPSSSPTPAPTPTPTPTSGPTCAYLLTAAQAQCYLNRYDDLRRAFGSSGAAAIAAAQQHWVNHGCPSTAHVESRDASCSGSSTPTPTPTPTTSSSPTPTPASSPRPTPTPTAGNLSITTTSLPGGVFNQSYTAFVNASGGNDTDYTWTITNLPAGLEKESMRTLTGTALANSPTVYITGKPAQDGSFSVKFTVTSGSQTVSKNLTLKIDPIYYGPPEECGNFMCDYGEDSINCPNDCGTASTKCEDNPSAWYLNRWPDVKNSPPGDARLHYCAYGRYEAGRENCFPATLCAGGSGSCWQWSWLMGNFYEANCRHNPLPN